MELVAAIAGQLLGTSLSPEMWVAVGLVVAFATNLASFVRALLVAALLLIGLRAAVLGNFGFLPATLTALLLWSLLGWGLRVLLVGNKLKPASAVGTMSSGPPAKSLACEAASEPKYLAAQEPQRDKPLLPPKLVLRSSIRIIPYVASAVAIILLTVSLYLAVLVHREVMLLKAAYLADKAAKVIPDCTKAAKSAGFDVNPFAALSPSSVALAAEYVASWKPLKVVRDFDPSGSAETWPSRLVLLIDIGDRKKRGFCRHDLITGHTEFVHPDSQPSDSLKLPYP